jgi:hypothetical protein
LRFKIRGGTGQERYLGFLLRFLNELSTKVPRHGAVSIHRLLELRLPVCFQEEGVSGKFDRSNHSGTGRFLAYPSATRTLPMLPMSRRTPRRPAMAAFCFPGAATPPPSTAQQKRGKRYHEKFDSFGSFRPGTRKTTSNRHQNEIFLLNFYSEAADQERRQILEQ